MTINNAKQSLLIMSYLYMRTDSHTCPVNFFFFFICTSENILKNNDKKLSIKKILRMLYNWYEASLKTKTIYFETF